MKEPQRWARKLAHLTIGHPYRVATGLLLVTGLALTLGLGLEINLNMVDMLPSHSPISQAYIDIQDRFGDPNIIVALEGERDRIVEVARVLEPRLQELEVLYNVSGRLPTDFAFQHGLMIQKPRDLDRSLLTLSDPTLLGMLRGINDDYEREYADNEENLRRDEVEIARSLLGLERSLEVLEANLAAPDPPPIEEAVDAMLIGEEWMLSLDREMLLIFCTPWVSFIDNEGVVRATEEVLAVLEEVRPLFPDVDANLTGAGALQKDELDSIDRNTQLLSVVALVAIYLLLAVNFRGWVLPLIALAPLLTGIAWTMGVLRLLFGSLNLFTVMVMVILLGLGIDFTIHLLSRYGEERASGKDPVEAAAWMLGGTGVGVLTGGLTTAAAFFALMVADTRGVYELGVAAGGGIALTLLAVMVTLPVLLAFLERWRAWRGGEVRQEVRGIRGGDGSFGFLGETSLFSWRRRWLVFGIFLPVVVLAAIGASRSRYEWDLLEIEPEGLKNVELARAIPRRYGITDQGAWLVASTVERSRELKEELRELPGVGDVGAVSDFLPAPQWVEDHTRKLEAFREDVRERRRGRALDGSGDGLGDAGATAYAAALTAEIERLWDNLDLVSNLAFQAGLDRVVRSIDRITGYDSETDATDPGAALPTLARTLESDPEEAIVYEVLRRWEAHAYTRVEGIADPTPFGVEALPPSVLRNHVPRDDGEGFLITVSARDYLFDKAALTRFSEQVEEVDPTIIGTPKLLIVVMEETLRDARNGALLALGVIIVLLLVHFRGPAGLLAMIPLVGAALLMLGLWYAAGFKHNWISLIAIPVILGIGIDDGVHALHRYREQIGTASERVYDSFRFVGRAILMTSLTTMIGFGSLAFYEMKGIASFGLLLFIGVGLCFVTTTLVLPAALGIFVGDD